MLSHALQCQRPWSHLQFSDAMQKHEFASKGILWLKQKKKQVNVLERRRLQTSAAVFFEESLHCQAISLCVKNITSR